MKIKFTLPPVKESIPVIIVVSVYCILAAVFIGFRQEHLWIAVFFCTLFFASESSRKLIVGLLPFIIFGISYDCLRLYPNYLVNPIDVKDMYELELSLFGIPLDNRIGIPSEYFASHNHLIVDFFAGIFYLGWVPVPVLFGVYLYLKNRKGLFLRFSMAFLFVNLIGFAGYYIHPTAPPWYAMNYGFEAILNTPGNTAGLTRFDDLIGFPVFNSIYGRNANVFAALPSLHSAYVLIAFFYELKDRGSTALLITLGMFTCGIWFTAVYTAHHYILDVLAGIFCTIAGVSIFEYGLMRMPFFKRFFNNYLNYISSNA